MKLSKNFSLEELTFSITANNHGIDNTPNAEVKDGIVFNRWYADMCYCGIPIEWEDML